MSETSGSAATFSAFLTGDFPYSAELQCFWMAFQGSMAVRNGKNRDCKMHWFHALLSSTLAGYAGATFTAMWIGRPTSMLSNDLNIAFSIIAFTVVNYLPFDIGYKLGNTFPIVLITTVFAQLFRAFGLIKFSQIAHEAFRATPSPYYPTPVFGPILLPTLLGNFGGFFSKGFDGHLKNGMPWAFQNGLFCSSFYHFYIHDEEGVIGATLRRLIGGLPDALGFDERTFAVLCVSVFMQVIPILQLKYFFGSSFSPFNAIHAACKMVGSKVTGGGNTTAARAIKRRKTKAKKT
jgi:hypothetical protein